MELINIIVHDNDTGIISINTFAIVESQLRDDVVEEAEDFFKEKCVELKFSNNENISEYTKDDFRETLDDAIVDGFIEIGNNTISFVWSYPENI